MVLVSRKRKRKGNIRMKLLRAALIFVVIAIPRLSYAQYTITPTVYYLNTTYTNATTGFTNVPGLAFAANPNGNYHATCHINWQSNTGTATPKYQFTGPIVNTFTLFTSMFSITGVTAFQTITVNTYSTAMANTGTPSATSTNFTDTIELTLVNGSNTGTVQLQAAANGAGTLTIQTTSNCIVQ